MTRRQMDCRGFARKNAVFAASFFFILFLATVSAHAAEESGSAAEQSAKEIFKWINFAIVAGVIVWVFAKKLPVSFRNNAEKISLAITKATAAKADADRQLREAETKLANLQQEIAGFRATAEREAAAEGERIRNLTQSDAHKIQIAAKAEIEAAERTARLELKALAASLAVDGAETLLVMQLTPTAQNTLVANFVKSLEGKAN